MLGQFPQLPHESEDKKFLFSATEGSTFLAGISGSVYWDGLEIEWGDVNFVNPPYSRKLKDAFVKKAVEDLKKGKIEFKVDKSGVINNFVGKLSFSKENLVENIESLLSAISKSKPATAKGQFMRALFGSSTMGAGLRIDLNTVSLD